MSVARSMSASQLCNETISQSYDIESEFNPMEDGNKSCQALVAGNILKNKCMTLDSYGKMTKYAMSQHGEKRKKSIFASFRLSKKNSITGKEKENSSSDVSCTTEKEIESVQSSLEGSNQDEKLANGDSFKARKHYLTRMSSFVSRVAHRVQTGSEESPLSISRRKLERSQTITGNDFTPEKVDYVSFTDRVPGLMGIRNHGNTCFISAVIQCLTHTDSLAEYFVLDLYKNDLIRSSRINSKKYGSKGEITEQLANLLKSLWVLRYTPDISLKLKSTVEKFEPSYKGSNQHDAAEFLMFLLDKVHEDLNTASKRKYKKIKNSYGRPDEVVAAETLANHMRCNSSFVQAIFQAQFRSSLRCPHCLRESNTFDPYLFVSIPIPQKEVLSLFVTVVYLNQQPKQVKIGLSLLSSSTVKQLRDMLSADCGITAEHLVITEIDGEGFHRTFADNGSVNIITSTDPIYAVELTPLSPEGSDAFLLLTWVNVLIAEPENIRFGGVYQSQISRDICYPDLQKLLLKEMATMISMETLTSEQENGVFFIAVNTGGSCIVLDLGLDMPLLHEAIEEALSLCHPLGGPPHIKLILQWTKESKEEYIIDDVDHIDEHSSIDELKKKPTEYAAVSLNECLQLHTSTEMLSCGDAWHCPTCNRKQQVLKRLLLWSAPQVLVLHLKRFRQVSLSTNSSKLNTVVTFPLNGFDISEHMAWRHSPNTASIPMAEPPNSHKGLGGVWSPWRKPKKYDPASNDYVYDLYAVCNHHGRDLQGGHYTAVCRNPTNHKWYCFDDFSYEEISEEDVIAQDAYILFYQRRDDPNTHCFSVNSGANHWSYKIPFASLPSQLKSAPISEDSPHTPTSSEVKGEESLNHNMSPEDQLLEKTLPIHGKETPLLNGEATLTTAKYFTLDTAQVEINPPQRCKDGFERVNGEIKIEASVEPPEEFRSASAEKLPSGPDESSCKKDTEDDDTIPEIRIQPASLEVLASHRYRSVAGKSVIKVTMKSKPSEISSRPSSVASSSSSRSSLSDTSLPDKKESPVSDVTPDIVIDSKINFKENTHKTIHRRTNTNKIPSFVIVNTPTSSPRCSRPKVSTNKPRVHLKSESDSTTVTRTKVKEFGVSDKRYYSYPSTDRERLDSQIRPIVSKVTDKQTLLKNSDPEAVNYTKKTACKACNLNKGSRDYYKYATESSV